MANSITPLLDALKLCLCVQLAADGNAVCECCIVFGEEAPPMSGRCDCVCEEGQGFAWTRLIDTSWSENNLMKCPIGFWEVRIELGVYRCVSSEQTCVDTTTDSAKLADDAASLSRAVLCCEALSGKRWRPVSTTVIGPLGGCVGIALEIVVELGAL